MNGTEADFVQYDLMCQQHGCRACLVQWCSSLSKMLNAKVPSAFILKRNLLTVFSSIKCQTAQSHFQNWSSDSMKSGLSQRVSCQQPGGGFLWAEPIRETEWHYCTKVLGGTTGGFGGEGDGNDLPWWCSLKPPDTGPSFTILLVFK